MKKEDIYSHVYIRCEPEVTGHVDLEKGVIEVKSKPTWIVYPITRLEWDTHIRVLYELALKLSSEGTYDLFYERAILN